MAQENEKNKDQKSNTESQPPKELFPLLRKPLIPHYDCLPEATPVKEEEVRDAVRNKDTPIVGFGEFRQYKKINETRIIEPYKPEPPKEIIKSDIGSSIVAPTIEIENADRFLLEKIKGISVESLEGLLMMIQTYPDIGFVTMNRHHMDLLNDYQPYNYTICNYNDKDETNYVTISSNGLIEFYKGDADFMPLDRLLIEFQLYQGLQEISLFSTFYVWKAFVVWLKKIRMRKFLEAKAKLEAFFAEKFKTSNKI